jgi:predicted dehydrogenase
LSWTDATQALKQDIREGVLGRPKRFKTICQWPRPASYYQRNKWAGRKLTESGHVVNDSPLNNATAHFMHNMLYLLGAETDTSVDFARIEAEAYRAKPISNFDTAALRLETVTDVEVLFYTTHSVPEQRGPVMYFEFENAVVKAGYGDNSIVAEHNDGSRHYYGTVNDQPMNKVWQMLKACRGEGEVWCGLEAASKQTMVVEALQNALPHIPVFPSDLIRESAVGEDGTHRLTWVDGLQDVMWTAFMDGVLMAEKGPEWAKTVVIEA